MLLVLSLCCSVISANTPQTQRPRRATTLTPEGQQAVPANARAALLSVAVLPARNVLNDTETAALAAGVADSISNALKNLSALSVVDVDVVSKAAERFPQAGGTLGEADAIKLAGMVGAQVLVVSSYQRVAGQMRVEARLLRVGTGRVTPGGAVNVVSAYPDGYFDLLGRLATGVTDALHLVVRDEERARVRDVLSNSLSMEAYQLYIKGKQRLRAGTRQSITDALDFFNRALEKDPKYSLAFAALADANQRLAEIKEREKEDPARERQEAINSAQKAVAAKRNLGEGYRQLARAYAASGRYSEAAAAAQSAVVSLPNDAGAALEFERARGRGRLTWSPALARILAANPGLALVVPDLPRVTVENRSEYDVELRFVSEGNREYARVQLSPNSSRMVALLPGNYQVTAVSPLGTKDERFTFEVGYSYPLTYDASTWPVALIHVKNLTGIALQLTVGSTSLNVAVNQTSDLRLQPGTYGYSARAGAFSTSGEKTFQAGVYDWTFDSTNFPRAVVTIQNQTRGALFVRVGGQAVRVGPGASRQIILSPGSYSYSASSQGSSTSGEMNFGAGQSVWTFTEEIFRTEPDLSATIIIENVGNAPVRVTISGPTRRSLVVAAGGVKELAVTPGDYVISASAGNARKTDRFHLEPGQTERITYEPVLYRR